MIIKLQVLKAEGVRYVRITDRAGDLEDQSELTDELREALYQSPGGLRPKAYFYAEVSEGEVRLQEEAPWQDW